MIIVVATNNDNKLKEFNKLAKGYNIKFLSLKEVGINSDVEETGLTLKENSYLKASAISSLTNYPIIADDSGIFIDALPNILGVHSARYLNDATYKEKCLSILNELKGKDRNAYFECVITFIYKGKVKYFIGHCPGIIANEYKGCYGFGYDPIFIPDGFKATFAELGEDIKLNYSHRALAFKKLLAYLKEDDYEI